MTPEERASLLVDDMPWIVLGPVDLAELKRRIAEEIQKALDEEKA